MVPEWGKYSRWWFFPRGHPLDFKMTFGGFFMITFSTTFAFTGLIMIISPIFLVFFFKCIHCYPLPQIPQLINKMPRAMLPNASAPKKICQFSFSPWSATSPPPILSLNLHTHWMLWRHEASCCLEVSCSCSLVEAPWLEPTYSLSY